MKTEQIETYASDEWVEFFLLVRAHDDGDSCQSSSLELVEAILLLCEEWIVPLGVGLRLESRDRQQAGATDDEHPPARRFWFLRQREWDERIALRRYAADGAEREVESIGAAELRAFVAEALGSSSPMEGQEVAVAELSLSALRVGLPEGIMLAPLYDGRPARPVVVGDSRRSSILSPKSGGVATSPLRLRGGTSQYEESSIELEICWDFWTKHPAGIAQLRRALDRVFARGRGWQLDRGKIP